MVTNRSRINRGWLFPGFLITLLLVVAFPSTLVSIGEGLPEALAEVDIDTSGKGRAFASDGETSISSSQGDTFCGIVDEIAGGRFASLFDGFVNCNNNRNGIQQQGVRTGQFLVDYSFEKNSVNIGEMTHLTITIKDKNTGKPVTDAFVKLIVEPPNFVQTGKAVQGMYTDQGGQALFTLQIGPQSSNGLYSTQLEVTKDNYQSGRESTSFHVV
jgi:5-hydroxyisourate hydrolase-like protein (transthyretin family)